MSANKAIPFRFSDNFFTFVFVWHQEARRGQSIFTNEASDANDKIRKVNQAAYRRLVARHGRTPEAQYASWRKLLGTAVRQLQQYDAGRRILRQTQRIFRPKDIIITNCSPTVICMRREERADSLGSYVLNFPTAPFDLCARTGADSWIDSEPFIILAHELLHLIHFGRPTTANPSADEEMVTIGLAPATVWYDGIGGKPQRPPTENELRRQAGVPQRINHDTIALCTWYEKGRCALFEKHPYDACQRLSQATDEESVRMRHTPSRQSGNECRCDGTGPAIIIRE